MRNPEQFTIEGIGEIAITLCATTGCIDAIKINGTNQLEHLSERWWVEVADNFGANFSHDRVRVTEVPEYREEIEERYPGYHATAYLEWLSDALHEIGHAHNEYQYLYDRWTARSKVVDPSVKCCFEEMSDTLNDEMEAHEFALDRLREAKITKEKLIETYLSIALGGLGNYVDCMLHPARCTNIWYMQPDEYKNKLTGLYRTWLDRNMPELGSKTILELHERRCRFLIDERAT